MSKKNGSAVRPAAQARIGEVEALVNRVLTPELHDLFDLVCGRGELRHLGSGLHTYPARTEENHQALHAGCLELERRGLIRRQEDTPAHVLWVVAAIVARVMGDGESDAKGGT